MTHEQLTLIADPLPAPPYPGDVLANGWHFELNPSRIENSDTWTLAGQAASQGAQDMRPWLLLLWMRAWQQSPCGSLPADGDLIAARIGMDPRQFAAHRDILMRGWYLCTDGRLYHPVVTELVERMRNGRRKDRLRKEAQRAVDKSASPRRAKKISVPRDSRVSPTTGTGSGTGINPLPPTSAAGFRRFWGEWPEGSRKVAELRAAAEWVKQGCEASADAVLAGLRAAKASDQWAREGGRFVPKPANWLADRAWEGAVHTPTQACESVSEYMARMAAERAAEALRLEGAGLSDETRERLLALAGKAARAA